jgi:UDP-glucose 4-epimerase
MTEIMLRDASTAHALRHVILRYFNVAGADPLGRTGQSTKAATHLKVEFAARRAGGPARLVPACDLARSTLKWQPRFDDLRTIVTHALAWERKLTKTAGRRRVRRPHLKQPLARLARERGRCARSVCRRTSARLGERRTSSGCKLRK